VSFIGSDYRTYSGIYRSEMWRLGALPSISAMLYRFVLSNVLDSDKESKWFLVFGLVRSFVSAALAVWSLVFGTLRFSLARCAFNF